MEREVPSGRSDLGQAGACAAFLLIVYALTACPSIHVGDCAEIATAIATFGIPHPPGYPAFTFVSACLAALVPASEPAYAANLVCAAYGALACGFLWLVARQLGARPAAAWFASLSFGLGLTFWSACTAAEVYGFDVLLAVLVLVALLRAAREGSRNAWLLAGAACGLWLGHRTVNVLYLPGALLLFRARGGFAVPDARGKLAGALVAGVLAGALPYLYLPLASARDPALDIGDPSTLERFWTVVRGSPYTRHFADPSADRALYRLSQLARGLGSLRELGLAVVAAAVGLWTGWRARPRVTLALCTWIAVNLAFVAAYNVLDVQVFFLPTLLALALLAALAATDWLEHRSPYAKPAAALLVVTGAATGAWNFARADLSEMRLTELLVRDVFRSLPPDAIYLVNGDTTIHGSWYAQAVQGRRPDVCVVSIGHLVDWHVEALRRAHPELQWPERDPEANGALFARDLVRANLSPTRPVCIAPSVDPSTILAPEEDRVFQPFQRGLVLEVLATGSELDLRERGTWNLELLEGLLDELGPLPHPDMDSRSTLLQIAVALAQTAEMWRRIEEPAEEARALQRCLALDPDRHELAIHEDARRGLGIRTPLHRLGLRARARLAELRGE